MDFVDLFSGAGGLSEGLPEGNVYRDAILRSLYD